MKTLIKNILKFAFVAAFLVGGASLASAGSFETQPPSSIGGNGSGFLTLSSQSAVNGCPGCANSINTVSIDAPNFGNTDIFSAFLYFRNDGSSDITNAKGRITISNGTLEGRLSGSGASTVYDEAYLTNLPQDYDIELISVHVENTQGSTDPQFCGGYNYGPDNYSASQLSGSGVTIGSGGVLDTLYNGVCSQAYVYATYEVTNTTVDTQPTDPVVDTRSAVSVDQDSGTIRGRLTEGENVDVYFRWDDSDNISCNSGGQRENIDSNVDADFDFDFNLTNLNDDTRYYYIACAEDNNGDRFGTEVLFFDTLSNGGGNGGGSLEVETLTPTNLLVINNNGQATMRGRVLAGSTNYSYFVWAQEGVTLSCSSPDNRQIANDHTDTRISGDIFQWTLLALDEDVRYRYRACAAENTVIPFIAEGSYEDIEFDNGNNGGNEDEPIVETRDYDDVTASSARIDGRIKMFDFDEGKAFFIYGENQGDINDVDNDYDRYNQISNNGDDLRKLLVDGDVNSSSSYDYFENELISGLDSNETIYYRMCLEYREEVSGDRVIKCGDVNDFDTDRSDDGNNQNADTTTEPARNINRTIAQMCGRITGTDGSPVESWIEFRRSTESGFNRTRVRQRSDSTFCEEVSGLTPDTNYRFRSCIDSGSGPDCGIERNFRTLGSVVTPQGTRPFIFTRFPTNIRPNSATLNSAYVANATSATCRFDYGRTESLGLQTPSYTVNGVGACPHNFTKLAANTRYCVQAVIQTVNGSDRGDLICFNTPAAPVTGGPTPVPAPPVVVVEDEDEDLDLGLGLSLIRLDIDNDEEIVTRGEQVEYVIEWENISELDLEDLELEVTIPEEIQITDISRGRLDQDTNRIFFTIDELEGADYSENEDGEDGRMTVTGIVGRGTIGNLLTADAEVVYDNPVNDAQENARDFDLDEYGAVIAGQTASVFGLTNITFLGWLVILLGLFIIFLVARWLYLEREELRAQAYLTGGYGNNGYGAPQQPRMPIYRDPAPRYEVPPAAPQMPPAQAPRDDYYEPYRPNRG